MARLTGLEPATSGVTGRHSNQLSYTRVRCGSAVYGRAPKLSTVRFGCFAILVIFFARRNRQRPLLEQETSDVGRPGRLYDGLNDDQQRHAQ